MLRGWTRLSWSFAARARAVCALHEVQPEAVAYLQPGAYGFKVYSREPLEGVPVTLQPTHTREKAWPERSWCAAAGAARAVRCGWAGGRTGTLGSAAHCRLRASAQGRARQLARAGPLEGTRRAAAMPVGPDRAPFRPRARQAPAAQEPLLPGGRRLQLRAVLGDVRPVGNVRAAAHAAAVVWPVGAAGARFRGHAG
jgi:hypothetical protein